MSAANALDSRIHYRLIYYKDILYVQRVRTIDIGDLIASRDQIEIDKSWRRITEYSMTVNAIRRIESYQLPGKNALQIVRGNLTIDH